MRTGGPDLPSGRRSRSTSNGGSWLGFASRRRSASQMPMDQRTASLSSANGSPSSPTAGSHTNITSASEP